MNEFVALLEKEKGRTPMMNQKMMTLTFFKLYAVYIKKLRNSFFHTHFLTCLSKDASVLLKVYKLSIKAMILTFLKILFTSAQSL